MCGHAIESTTSIFLSSTLAMLIHQVRRKDLFCVTFCFILSLIQFDFPVTIFNDAVDETLIFLICMLLYYKVRLICTQTEFCCSNYSPYLILHSNTAFDGRLILEGLSLRSHHSGIPLFSSFTLLSA